MLNKKLHSFIQTLTTLADTQTKILCLTKGDNGYSILLSRLRANESLIANLIDGNALCYENTIEHDDLQAENAEIKKRISLVNFELEAAKQFYMRIIQESCKIYQGFLVDLSSRMSTK